MTIIANIMNVKIIYVPLSWQKDEGAATPPGNEADHIPSSFKIEFVPYPRGPFIEKSRSTMTQTW